MKSRAEEQLGHLAIGYYVLGGLMIPGSLIFLVHVGLGTVMLAGGMEGGSGPPPPEALDWVFVVLGLFGVLMGLTMGSLVIYAGRCLAKQRRLVFIYILAGLLCASFPLGTILGVLTFIALSNNDAKELFRRQA